MLGLASGVRVWIRVKGRVRVEGGLAEWYLLLRPEGRETMAAGTKGGQ